MRFVITDTQLMDKQTKKERQGKNYNPLIYQYRGIKMIGAVLRGVKSMDWTE